MIQVSISKERLAAFGNDIHAGLHVIGKLRDAGVPVSSVLWPWNVERGALKMDNNSGITVYTWEDTEETLF